MLDDAREFIMHLLEKVREFMDPKLWDDYYQHVMTYLMKLVTPTIHVSQNDKVGRLIANLLKYNMAITELDFQELKEKHIDLTSATRKEILRYLERNKKYAALHDEESRRQFLLDTGLIHSGNRDPNLRYPVNVNHPWAESDIEDDAVLIDPSSPKSPLPIVVHDTDPGNISTTTTTLGSDSRQPIFTFAETMSWKPNYFGLPTPPTPSAPPCESIKPLILSFSKGADA